MYFNSVDFLIFFPIVLLVYYLLPQRVRYIWLLVASYYFYMCWNAKYALLILTSTVITYVVGLLLPRLGYKKWILATGICANLAILFFFKYFDMTCGILASLLRVIHVELQAPQFDVILPVGISFYTFQALGYIIDVYRKDVEPEKNFLRYALFVSFFPQLVAGPIERSKNLLGQLKTPTKFEFERARDGLLLMIWGFFLKLVLADRIATFVDYVYGDYHSLNGFYIVVATMLFAVQIYCDFAGYSVIAMGAAKILGIQLMENFNAPYLATNVGDFWRRWHISLTSWFKDYLYIPLGGSRKGKFRKYLNKLIVFGVSGLWHGAKFSFVAWGLLNGLYQVTGEICEPARQCIREKLKIKTDSFAHKALHIVITFILVDFSWLFFRASSFSEALQMIRCTFANWNPWILFDGSLYQCGLIRQEFLLMLICIAILGFADICKAKNIVIREVAMRQNAWARVLFIVAAIMFVLVFGVYGTEYNAANFIYFQF